MFSPLKRFAFVQIFNGAKSRSFNSRAFNSQLNTIWLKSNTSLRAASAALLSTSAALALYTTYQKEISVKCETANSIGNEEDASPFANLLRPVHKVYDIPLGDDFPNSLPCFIEVAKGSRNKYEWDNTLGLLRLDRVLHSAVFYPHNYGFIPQTLCKDGDALDVLVLGEVAIPGSIVDIRPLGYMVMEDEKGADEKVIAVPIHDPRYAEFLTLRDVPEHYLREIAHFFETYKALEKKKWVKVGGWKGTEDTKLLIEATHRYYLMKQKQEILEEYDEDVYKRVYDEPDKKKLEEYNRDVYNMVRRESQKMPLERYNAEVYNKVEEEALEGYNQKVYDNVQKEALENYNDKVYKMVRRESREPLEKYNAEVYNKVEEEALEGYNEKVYDDVQKEALESYNDNVYKMVRRESREPLEKYNAEVYNKVEQEALEGYNDKIYKSVQKQALEGYNDNVYKMVRRESAAAKKNPPPSK